MSTHISGVVLVDFDQLICSGVLRVNPAGGSAPQPCGVQVMPHLHNALRVVLAPALVEGVVLHDRNEGAVILSQHTMAVF
jgi:hypothetical protein